MGSNFGAESHITSHTHRLTLETLPVGGRQKTLTSVEERQAMPDLPDQTVWQSRGPASLSEFDHFLAQLARLGVSLEHAGEAERGDRRGAPTVADPLMFAIKGFGAIWSHTHGKNPEHARRKRGGFGDLCIRAMELANYPFDTSEVKSAVRRYMENPGARGRRVSGLWEP
jgi:hypothetical protein